jgi:hypothetical protein
MDCNNWLEKYIKDYGSVSPKDVYKAGKTEGFTRADIKKARRWHGKFIDTQTHGDATLWRWE